MFLSSRETAENAQQETRISVRGLRHGRARRRGPRNTRRRGLQNKRRRSREVRRAEVLRPPPKATRRFYRKRRKAGECWSQRSSMSPLQSPPSGRAVAPTLATNPLRLRSPAGRGTVLVPHGCPSRSARASGGNACVRGEVSSARRGVGGSRWAAGSPLLTTS